jgi:hypothetical protein
MTIVGQFLPEFSLDAAKGRLIHHYLARKA